MPLDVICPGCRGVFFETNDNDGRNPHAKQRPGAMPVGTTSTMIRKYDPDLMASSAMIRMKDKFIGVYDDIQHDVDLFGSGIEPCPGCGGSLSNDNFKLETRSQPIIVDILYNPL